MDHRFIFLKTLFIYSERERERERGRDSGREKQAPCKKPDMGLDPGSPGSRPGLLVALNRCATGAALLHTLSINCFCTKRPEMVSVAYSQVYLAIELDSVVQFLPDGPSANGQQRSPVSEPTGPRAPGDGHECWCVSTWKGLWRSCGPQPFQKQESFQNNSVSLSKRRVKVLRITRGYAMQKAFVLGDKPQGWSAPRCSLPGQWAS